MSEIPTVGKIKGIISRRFKVRFFQSTWTSMFNLLLVSCQKSVKLNLHKDGMGHQTMKQHTTMQAMAQRTMTKTAVLLLASIP